MAFGSNNTSKSVWDSLLEVQQEITVPSAVRSGDASATANFIKNMRDACVKHGLLLVFDEEISRKNNEYFASTASVTQIEDTDDETDTLETAAYGKLGGENATLFARADAVLGLLGLG